MKPNELPKVSTFTAASFRALKAGTATEQQQQEFYRFLLLELGQIQMDPFSDSERSTAFMLGRQWVARQVASICDIPMESLSKKENSSFPKTGKRK